MTCMQEKLRKIWFLALFLWFNKAHNYYWLDDIVENKTEEASYEKSASKVDFQEEVMTTQLSVSEDNILNDVHENEDIKKHEVATKVPSSGQVSMWDECEIVIWFLMYNFITFLV